MPASASPIKINTHALTSKKSTFFTKYWIKDLKRIHLQHEKENQKNEIIEKQRIKRQYHKYNQTMNQKQKYLSITTKIPS